MSIYRGAGGSGDATADSSSEALLIRELAVEVQADADAAAASATAASGSASTASTAATNAASSATAAASSATSASSSASSATSSASAASTSATNAATSATAAQTAETNAETAEANAETAETNAASSASAASTSASSASSSASAASTSATSAASSASSASTSASNASTSATNAASSASSASTSASNAATSETNAASSASSASTSASTATTQAGIATTKASEAATSATNAASSASSASTSASTATTQATNASNSASAASTSATNASNSASAAATSATNAAASATLAASYTPSQTGNAGKYLTTDGTNTSWDALATVANSGSYNDLSDKPTLATTLDSLSDVIITSPTTDQVLKYNGSDWVNGASASSYNGMKNRIINGHMVVDQRGATGVPSNAGYTLDRWQALQSGGGAYSVQQSSVAPAGFSKSLLCTVTTTDTSFSTSDYYFIDQLIEGNNVSDLGWGSADAKTVTVSFWVRSNVTGLFGGSLMNAGWNRSYPFSYTINVADTWEQKSVTITGDTAGTWLTTNGVGIRVIFGFAFGSNYVGTGGAWTASEKYTVSSAVNWLATSGNTFYLTGVQLEEGTTATSFEREIYSVTLQKCQRYYERTNGQPVYLTYYSASLSLTNVFYKVTKRATPTITLVSPSSGSIVAGSGDIHGNYLYISSVATGYSSEYSASAEL